MNNRVCAVCKIKISEDASCYVTLSGVVRCSACMRDASLPKPIPESEIMKAKGIGLSAAKYQERMGIRRDG